MKKVILSTLLIVGFAAPCFAASEFYIVRGADKKCTVVETRPTDKTVMIIGDKAYVSREEADKQLQLVCK